MSNDPVARIIPPVCPTHTRARTALLALSTLLAACGCAAYPYVEFRPRAEPPLGEMRDQHAVVRVLFATDRRPTGRLGGQAFGSERSDTLYRGWLDVSIPAAHGRGRLEAPAPLRRPSPDLDVLVTQTWITQRPEPFFQELRERVAQSPRREVLVFVHGFAVTFEDAARRTAQIAHDIRFRGVPIAYSWPSRGAVRSYFVDPANAEWSSHYLTLFLDELVRESGAERIHLMAHSMGTRVLARAVKDYLALRTLQRIQSGDELAAGAARGRAEAGDPAGSASAARDRDPVHDFADPAGAAGAPSGDAAQSKPVDPLLLASSAGDGRGGGPPFCEIVLAAADMDQSIFERDYAPYLANASRRLTLYISAADWALGTAAYLLGYRRVGQQPLGGVDSALLLDRIQVIDATQFDRGVVGHMYYGSSPDVLEDLAALLRGEPAEKRSLRREFLYRLAP